MISECCNESLTISLDRVSNDKLCLFAHNFSELFFYTPLYLCVNKLMVYTNIYPIEPWHTYVGNIFCIPYIWEEISIFVSPTLTEIPWNVKAIKCSRFVEICRRSINSILNTWRSLPHIPAYLLSLSYVVQVASAIFSEWVSVWFVTK